MAQSRSSGMLQQNSQATNIQAVSQDFKSEAFSVDDNGFDNERIRQMKELLRRDNIPDGGEGTFNVSSPNRK